MQPPTAPKHEIRPQDLAHLAHDLRNLLALVCGHAELQLAGAPADSDLHESLAAMERAGRRGAGLCQEIMELARDESPVLQAVNVSALAAQVKRLFAARLGSRIQFQEIGPDDVFVQAAPGRLERALLNLLWNAEDAILTTKAPQGNIHLRWNRDQDCVFLEVADDGPGLPGGAIGDLAEAFRSTRTDNSAEEIRGLGLHGVAEAALLFGGNLHGDQDPELGGARLRLILPAVQGESQVPSIQTAINE